MDTSTVPAANATVVSAESLAPDLNVQSLEQGIDRGEFDALLEDELAEELGLTPEDEQLIVNG